MSIILRWEQATTSNGNTFGLCYFITEEEAIPMIYSYNTEEISIYHVNKYEILIEKIYDYEKIVGYFNSYGCEGMMSVQRPKNEENIGIYSLPDCSRHINGTEEKTYKLNQIINLGKYQKIPTEYHKKIKNIDKKWNLK